MSKNIKHPRKIVAMALVGLGLAGVSIASAASLVVNGQNSSLAQAGTDDLTISVCQTSTIDVYYGLDDGSGNGAGDLIAGTGDVADFGFVAAEDVLVLDSIDPACGDKALHVAVGDSTGAEIARYEGTVPGGGGLVQLPASVWTPGPAAGNLADLARVSVTIFDQA